MNKFDIDFSDVAKLVYPDKNKIPLKGNEDRLIRVAFDLFRLKDEGEDLWMVQSSEDGQEFLVRTYSLPEDELPVKSSSWFVLADQKQENLTISYKNIPISKVACKDYNVKTEQEVEILRNTLNTKLSTDENFVNKYVKSLPLLKREALKGAGLSIEEKYGESLSPDEEKDLDNYLKKYFNESKAEDYPFEKEEVEIEKLSPEWRQELEKVLSVVFEGDEDVITSAPKISNRLNKLLKKAIDEDLEETYKDIVDVLYEEE